MARRTFLNWFVPLWAACACSAYGQSISIPLDYGAFAPPSTGCNLVLPVQSRIGFTWMATLPDVPFGAVDSDGSMIRGAAKMFYLVMKSSLLSLWFPQAIWSGIVYQVTSRHKQPS